MYSDGDLMRLCAKWICKQLQNFFRGVYNTVDNPKNMFSDFKVTTMAYIQCKAFN